MHVSSNKHGSRSHSPDSILTEKGCFSSIENPFNEGSVVTECVDGSIRLLRELRKCVMNDYFIKQRYHGKHEDVKIGEGSHRL